jgi:hypothetical protein
MIFSLLLTYSCKETIPSDVIKPTKMQDVMWDVLRAESLSQEIVRADSSKSVAAENIRLTKKIFLLHNVTEQQFEKSYFYYTAHPDIMRTILDSLNSQQAKKIYSSPVTIKKELTDTTFR